MDICSSLCLICGAVMKNRLMEEGGDLCSRLGSATNILGAFVCATNILGAQPQLLPAANEGVEPYNHFTECSPKT